MECRRCGSETYCKTGICQFCAEESFSRTMGEDAFVSGVFDL